MTHEEKILEAITKHILKHGKPPADSAKLESMTGLSSRYVSRAMGRLRDNGEINFTPRDYSSVTVPDGAQGGILRAPSPPKSKKKKRAAKTRSPSAEIVQELRRLDDVRASALAKSPVKKFAIVDALERKREELLDQKADIEEKVQCLDKAISVFCAT